MKKIMFNDRYGLTQAVLEGKKNMTRRIIPDIEIDWNRRGVVALAKVATRAAVRLAGSWRAERRDVRWKM